MRRFMALLTLYLRAAGDYTSARRGTAMNALRLCVLVLLAAVAAVGCAGLRQASPGPAQAAAGPGVLSGAAPDVIQGGDRPRRWITLRTAGQNIDFQGLA